jgi:hypothetical protein
MRTPLAALIAVFFALIAVVACAGDSDAESYFEDLQRLNNSEPFDQRRAEFDVLMPSLVERPPESPLTLEEREEVAALYRAFTGDIAEVVDELTAMSPPRELESRHNALIAAHQTMLELFDGLAADLAVAETQSELAMLLGADAFMSEGARMQRAIEELEREAESRGLRLDLSNLD